MLHWRGLSGCVCRRTRGWQEPAMGVSSKPCVTSPLRQCRLVWAPRGKACAAGVSWSGEGCSGQTLNAMYWVGAELPACELLLALPAPVDAWLPLLPWEHKVSRSLQPPAGSRAHEGQRQGESRHLTQDCGNICCCVEGAEVSAHG